MPGGELGIVSTHRDRRTLLHGELNVLDADSETMASAGIEFLQFQN